MKSKRCLVELEITRRKRQRREERSNLLLGVSLVATVLALVVGFMLRQESKAPNKVDIQVSVPNIGTAAPQITAMPVSPAILIPELEDAINVRDKILAQDREIMVKANATMTRQRHLIAKQHALIERLEAGPITWKAVDNWRGPAPVATTTNAQKDRYSYPGNLAVSIANPPQSWTTIHPIPLRSDAPQTFATPRRP